MAKKNTKRKRLQIKYLIADPSFFTAKNGLRKLENLVDNIAEFQSSKLSTSKIKTKVAATSGGTETISSTGSGGRGSRSGFGSSYPELEKHRPTIVLPSVLKALEDLQGRKVTVEEIFQDDELKEVFKGWGVKTSAFENRIKELKDDKMFIQFFNVHKIEYATADKFEYDEEKIGTNSIHPGGCNEVLGWAKGKVYFQILGVSQSSKAKYRSIIAHGKKFIQDTKKLGIIQYRTIGSRATVSTSTFVIDQTKDDFINNMSIDFPIDLALLQSLDIVLPYAGTLGVIIYQGSKLFIHMKKLRAEEKQESTQLKQWIDTVCKEDGMILPIELPKSSKKKN